MPKISLLFVAAMALFVTVSAQTAPKSLKKTLELKMPKTAKDDMCGTRGASVVWHPLQQKYYAVFAGNQSYPLAVFNDKGKRLSDEEQTTLFDIRGMWYNKVSKTLQMNGYSESGWAEYKLDSKGIPAELGLLFEGMNQPDAQSAGLYNAREKSVCFFDVNGNLAAYDLATGEELSSFALHLGKQKASDEFENEDVWNEYNGVAAYTDLPGSEIALLNHYNRKIELYSLRTGYKVKELALPDDAPVEEIFNFAYSNGKFWLFDIDARTWKGYQ